MKSAFNLSAFLAAALLLGNQGHAETKKNGNQKPNPCKVCPPEPNQVPCNPAYNAPANIDTECSWDVNATVGFIYWQPMQENLELGIESTAGSYYGPVHNMDFEFKPGFQITVGGLTAYDDWSVWGEYTWFHGKHFESVSVASTNFLSQIHLSPALANGGAVASLTRNWTLNMDLADLMTGREYYVGTKFVFKPSFGLRGAFIRQKLIDSFSGLGGAGGNGGLSVQTNAIGFGGDTPLSIEGISQSWSRSWAVGPKMELDISWKLGSGFRAIGNGSADILYTRYNGLKNNSWVFYTFTDGIDNFYTQTTLRTKQKNLGLLRTHLDLELGFGWGTYFFENQKHFDIAATYNFQVFFNQNMFRQFTDGSIYANSILPNGDLFVQGLNLACRFDF